MTDITGPTKRQKGNPINMHKETGRKFEYMNAYSAHERRFDNITLPQIATSNKKTPSLTYNYALQKIEDGRMQPESSGTKQQVVGDRNYDPIFSQVQKKSGFTMSFKAKSHVDAFVADQRMLETPKKVTNAEKLLRKVKIEE